ncbi:hypothetical protein TSOC_009776 [Tetrabaena socialis]|uniref:Uncharacterized protein n=1 Tax=Tetrabaena socialis TaxID=47790 RepID=A0A2J7ZUY3_9CHLO|nr:hypothetical protein TSOC_009776 [Tetrabaena socialis]|eukprot:PNH04087.1 hypothetical protein TSOC_009776 [Tetrabaena socialis]
MKGLLTLSAPSLIHPTHLPPPCPDTGGRGWPPHRDRPTMPLLPPDRLPPYLTLWVALTPATPDNGCIHVLPADLDPLYDSPLAATAVQHDVPAVQERGDSVAPSGGGRSVGDGVEEGGGGPEGGQSGWRRGAGSDEHEDEDGRDGCDPTVAGNDLTVTDLQAVRALPAAAGEALVWSGRLLHWGGAADAGGCDDDGGEGDGDGSWRDAAATAAAAVSSSAPPPPPPPPPAIVPAARVSLSFAASAPCFEDPALRGVDLDGAAALPTLAQRLGLVGVQLAVHEHGEPLGPGLRELVERLEEGFGARVPASSPA